MTASHVQLQVPLETEEVHCDLCGGHESYLLYTLQDTAYKVSGEFVLRQCERCGLIYLSPRPTPNSISAYYPSEYSPYRPPIEDERFALMRWMRRRKLIKRREFIEHYLEQKAGRILDVGCATGLFLHEMELNGWQAAGIEPISSAAEFARKHFGLDVFEGTMHDAPYREASFDVVTFWDVLEHTFSPSEELRQAARLLRPKGLLVLSVPNWHSPDRRMFGRHWQGLDSPRHLYVFTRATLDTLLTKMGFSIVARKCFIPSYFSFAMSVERWLDSFSPRLSRVSGRILNIPGVRFLFEPWFTVNSWLGRGAIVTVFAQKIESS